MSNGFYTLFESSFHKSNAFKRFCAEWLKVGAKRCSGICDYISLKGEKICTILKEDADISITPNSVIRIAWGSGDSRDFQIETNIRGFEEEQFRYLTKRDFNALGFIDCVASDIIEDDSDYIKQGMEGVKEWCEEHFDEAKKHLKDSLSFDEFITQLEQSECCEFELKNGRTMVLNLDNIDDWFSNPKVEVWGEDGVIASYPVDGFGGWYEAFEEKMEECSTEGYTCSEDKWGYSVDCDFYYADVYDHMVDNLLWRLLKRAFEVLFLSECKLTC